MKKKLKTFVTENGRLKKLNYSIRDGITRLHLKYNAVPCISSLLHMKLCKFELTLNLGPTLVEKVNIRQGRIRKKEQSLLER